jgi:lipopolysaccharide exporter
VYKATGRPGILLKLGLLRAAVLVPAMIWGARYGIFGVALVQLAVSAASTFLNLYVAGRVLSLSARTLLSELRIAALGTVVMGVFLQLLLPLLAPMPVGVVLACGAGAGASIYLITVSLLDGDIPRQALLRVAAWLKGA